MYCSECGVKASGKYCHQCGAPLHASESVPVLLPIDDKLPTVSWEHDVRYARVIQVEAVRHTIAMLASHAKKGVSGEAILKLYDKVMASPIPLESLAKVIQPFYDSLGIRTTKKREEAIDLPIGRAIASTLCSFAKNNQSLQKTHQFEAHCLLVAELPSSLCSLAGTMLVELHRHGDGTRMVATAIIPGQAYDWGKGHRCLDQLFRDMQTDDGIGGLLSRKTA